MKVVEPSYEIILPSEQYDPISIIADAARTSYDSSVAEGCDKIAADEKLVRSCIRRGHNSVLEHAYMSVLFTTDRGIGNELTRHRHLSPTQSSTRYISYAKMKYGRQISVIKPNDIEEDTAAHRVWLRACRSAERDYIMLSQVTTPEMARSVLPLCTATTIYCTANMAEWRHIFKLRAADMTGKAHPDMKKLMIPLALECAERFPPLFDDIAKIILCKQPDADTDE